MIPYFEWHQISIGPVHLQVWGLMVALGILVSAWLVERRAQKSGLDSNQALTVLLWLLVGIFLGARLFYIFFYASGDYRQNWWLIFEVGQGGWSAAGGVIGALMTFFILSRLSIYGWLRDRRAWDVIAGAWPLGMAVGRLGCFFIHDHIGRPAQFFLAVKFPDGLRHELGGYESLIMLVVAGTLPWIEPRLKKYPGALTVLLVAGYLTLRIGLDFLRADDGLWSEKRFGGLTPTQWLGLLGLATIAVVSLLSRLTHRIVAPKL